MKITEEQAKKTAALKTIQMKRNKKLAGQKTNNLITTAEVRKTKKITTKLGYRRCRYFLV